MGRLRGFLWLVAGLAIASLAGVIAFVVLTKAADQTAGGESVKPQVSVVVASGTIAVRSVLGPEDLSVRQVPVDTVAEGAISDVAEAEGKITLVDLYAGEVILFQRLLEPNIISGDGRLALLVREDEVLMAVPARDLMSSVGVLKAGDHVDVLVSLEFPADWSRGIASDSTTSRSGGSSDEELATFSVLENIQIAGIIGGEASTEETTKGTLSTGAAPRAAARSPDAILLTLSPQDALVLKYAQDADGVFDIVLRAPGIERPFSVEPVDAQYVIDRFQIPIGAE